MSSKIKPNKSLFCFFCYLIRQAINLEETAVGLNKRRLIQSAVVKELVRVCKNQNFILKVLFFFI
jgi:hypothetical protein